MARRPKTSETWVQTYALEDYFAQDYAGTLDTTTVVVPTEGQTYAAQDYFAENYAA